MFKDKNRTFLPVQENDKEKVQKEMQRSNRRAEKEDAHKDKTDRRMAGPGDKRVYELLWSTWKYGQDKRLSAAL